MRPQHAIVKSTRRLPKGQRHERMEKDDHRKQSEKRDVEYKCVYPCKGRWEGEDHLEGLGETIGDGEVAVELGDRGSVSGADEMG